MTAQLRSALRVVIFENFSPAQSIELLATNGPDRTPVPEVWQCYAQQMRAGEWHVDGNTFKVNRSGQLIDGQHRLTAAIAAGFTFPAVIIVYGISDEAAHAMDPPGGEWGCMA